MHQDAPQAPSGPDGSEAATPGWTPTRITRPAVPAQGAPGAAGLPAEPAARTGQPYPGPQPYAGQPHPGPQPYPGQPYPGQPHPYPGQPHPGLQPHAGQPHPGPQPYAGQPYPGPNAVVPVPYAGLGWQPAAPPATRRFGLPGWVIALIAVPVVLVGLGVVASVAVPVFLQQRTKSAWAATTVTFPETLLGLTRRPDLEQQVGAQALGSGLPVGTQFRMYTDSAGRGVVVIAYRSTAPQSDLAQRATWAGFENALRASELPGLILIDRAPGPLGGRFACGTVDVRTMCLATDSAVTLAIVGAKEPEDSVASVRAEIEHQAG